MTELDLSEMKLSELELSISVKSYDEKTAGNYWNCYVAEKRIVSKPSMISIPNFDSTNEIIEWRLYQNSTSLFLYFPRNKPSKIVTVGSGRVGLSLAGPGRARPGRVKPGRAGSGRFIVLNDSAGPKMVIHLYLTFFRFFLKVQEPI